MLAAGRASQIAVGRMDTRTSEQRSRIMAAVGTKNTGPELIVRRLLTSWGYRYRLHRRDLPGRPDVVFPGRRKVLFVHGCFWHGHNCSKGRLPKSRIEYWRTKINSNVDRDTRAIADLKQLGWSSAVIWQCETKDPDTLALRLRAILGETGPLQRIIERKKQ